MSVKDTLLAVSGLLGGSGGGGGDITLTTLNVSANGTTNAPSGTAYNKVIAAVNPTLTTKSIAANGSYAASTDNADGYSEVTVNVSTESHPYITYTEYTHTENWTTSALGGSTINFANTYCPNRGLYFCGFINTDPDDPNEPYYALRCLVLRKHNDVLAGDFLRYNGTWNDNLQNNSAFCIKAGAKIGVWYLPYTTELEDYV